MIKALTFQLILLRCSCYCWLPLGNVAACVLFEVGSDVGSLEPNSEAAMPLHKVGMET